MNKKIISVVIALVLIMGFVIVSKMRLFAGGAPLSDGNNITVEKVKTLIDSNEELFLLDVRTDREYKGGHIEGTRLIPVNSVNGRLAEIPKDKDVIVMCAVGGRSSAVTKFLLESGYSRVYNMLGGMKEWEKKRYPTVK